jgi:hypothetical protein
VENRGAMTETDTLPIDSIRKAIVRSQRVYLVLAVIGALIGVSELLSERAMPPKTLAANTIWAYTCSLIYIGVRYRRAWVVPFIRMVSACSCALSAVNILYPANTGKEILAKVISLLLFVFFTGQFTFFGRDRVRKYLRDEGLEVF